MDSLKPQWETFDRWSIYPKHNVETPLDAAVREWIQRGENVPLRDVPYQIYDSISWKFPPQENWRKLATELGVENIHDLSKIEGLSIVTQRYPSLVLLLHCIEASRLSFADLLTVLYQKLRRLDCLQELYDLRYVEDFFNKRECSGREEPPPYMSREPMEDDVSDLVGIPLLNQPKADGTPAVGPEVPPTIWTERKNLSQIPKPLTMDSILEVVKACKVTNNRPMLKLAKTENLIVASCPEIIQSNDHRKVLSDNNLQNKSGGDDTGPMQPITNSPVRSNGSSRGQKVVVLLTYSADVNEAVPELVQRFWDAGIGVVAEWVLRGKGFFETNLIEAWENFFHQSHFVVPIISPQYLKDTRQPPGNEQARGVRFIYDLYTRKYVKDGCLNNMVRPLVTNTVQPKMLNRINPTLEVRWRLAEDLENFIDMIKRYAQIRPVT